MKKLLVVVALLSMTSCDKPHKKIETNELVKYYPPVEEDRFKKIVSSYEIIEEKPAQLDKTLASFNDQQLLSQLNIVSARCNRLMNELEDRNYGVVLDKSQRSLLRVASVGSESSCPSDPFKLVRNVEIKDTHLPVK